MGGGRSTIASLVGLVLMAALVLAALRPSESLAGMVLNLVLLLTATIVVYPIIHQHRTYWFRAEPIFVDYDPWTLRMPRVVAERLTGMMGEFDRLGFIFRGHFREIESSSSLHAAGFVTLLEDGRTHDVAQIIIVAVPRRAHVTVSLLTRAIEGPGVATSNSRVPRIMPGRPDLWETAVFPDVEEMAVLHLIHRARAARIAARPDPIGDDPIAYLTAETRETLAGYVRAGYYRLDTSRGVYRTTWKGATLMRLRLLRPVVSLQRALRRRRAAKILKELGIDPRPREAAPISPSAPPG